MDYKVVHIENAKRVTPETSVLIIYTGGTIGMMYDGDGALAPFDFGQVLARIPEISSLAVHLTVIAFQEPLDSSNVDHEHWQQLGQIISENYDDYDGFVILHGTDTMAYSASALSFMLDGLSKPVIFTGAQIPIGQIRSDARENLITAIEIASAREDGDAIVKEVCIFFNFTLLRGNRAQKVRSSTFAAFETQNYPILAESGIFIEYNYPALSVGHAEKGLTFKSKFDPGVVILRIFPGISEAVVAAILGIKGIRGVVLESFGSGNTMNHSWFLENLRSAIDRGIIIYNVSQCSGGEVIHGRYETSKRLEEIGVIGGGDITTEAAVTKLMFLLGMEKDLSAVREKLPIPLVGEMDIEPEVK